MVWRGRRRMRRMQIVDVPSGLTASLGDRWELEPLGASTFCETWQARQGRQRLFVKSGT